MPRKKMIIATGQTEEVETQGDLNELIGNKRQSKFDKFASRDDYKEFLYSLGTFELNEELLRLGSFPSCERKIAVERALGLYDRSKNPRKVGKISQKERSLEDIIK